MAPSPRHSIKDLIVLGLVQLITLPYHRFFNYNTLKPAQEILRYADNGVQQYSTDRVRLYRVLVEWRSRKQHELKFVAVAAVTLTAIVTASFSWASVLNSHWVGPAFWYASLMTSVCGILLAAQQQSLLSLIGDLPDSEQAPTATVIKRHLSQILADAPADREAVGGSRRWVMSWKMVFTWQCPMMYVGYAFLYYFIGLTVVICSPLILQPWGTNSYIAVAYIVAAVMAWGMFAYCSLGGYHAISLYDEEESESVDEAPITQAEVNVLSEEKAIR